MQLKCFFFVCFSVFKETNILPVQLLQTQSLSWLAPYDRVKVGQSLWNSQLASVPSELFRCFPQRAFSRVSYTCWWKIVIRVTRSGEKVLLCAALPPQFCSPPLTPSRRVHQASSVTLSVSEATMSRSVIGEAPAPGG